MSQLAKSLDGAVKQFRSRPLDVGSYRFALIAPYSRPAILVNQRNKSHRQKVYGPLTGPGSMTKSMNLNIPETSAAVRRVLPPELRSPRAISG
jgi:hypothetical protein